MDEQPELSRRTALGALLGLLIAACGSGGGASKATSSASPTSPASGSTSSPPASSSAPSTTTAIVPGSNTNVTHEVLLSDAGSYDGAWKGAWTEAESGLSGTITGSVTIDPDARTYTAEVALGAAFLPGATVAPFTVTVSADSYTYGDDGSFSLSGTTPLGNATISSDQGIGTGTFKLHIEDVPGHTDVKSLDFSGVTIRPAEIPVDFTVTFKDATSASGHISFTPGQ